MHAAGPTLEEARAQFTLGSLKHRPQEDSQHFALRALVYMGLWRLLLLHITTASQALYGDCGP